MKDRHITLKQ